MAESTVSTSQHTENYDLPIWDKDDLTSWQGNLNDAFTKIDRAINENRVAMATFQEQLDALGESGEQTDTSVNKVKEALAELEETVITVNLNLESLEKAVDAWKDDYAAQITNIAGQFNTLNATIEDLEDDIGSVGTRLTEAVNSLGTDLGALTTRRSLTIDLTDRNGTDGVSIHVDAYTVGAMVRFIIDGTFLRPNSGVNYVQYAFDFTEELLNFITENGKWTAGLTGTTAVMLSASGAYIAYMYTSTQAFNLTIMRMNPDTADSHDGTSGSFSNKEIVAARYNPK